jgi:hypothetical protein
MASINITLVTKKSALILAYSFAEMPICDFDYWPQLFVASEYS